MLTVGALFVTVILYIPEEVYVILLLVNVAVIFEYIVSPAVGVPERVPPDETESHHPAGVELSISDIV